MSANILTWLLGDARRSETTLALIDEIGRRLNAGGIDVRRITTGVPILHPQVASYSALWNRGGDATERVYHFDQTTMDALGVSPIVIVYRGGGPVRCRIDKTPEAGEYPIIADLRAEGMTDYVVMPARFSDGTTKAISFATDRPGGFDEADIATLEALMPPLAMVLEIQTLKRTARILLETYVGPKTGRRVLDGAIRRGMGETIRAAIWLSDLRGFTEMSERLPGDAVIALLNDYFGALGQAVERQGGEILKFIGDAMLAIFPVTGDDVTRVCRAALAAAEEAVAAVASRPDRPFAFGVALHVGDVIYGNIGSATRLDFTVIGPAVNLAARISGMCATLGRTVLLSEEFAGALDGDAEPVGTFELKGVARPQPVFAPRETGR